MSEQNVKLVRGLQPGREVDLAAMFRHDETWTALADGAAPLFHSDLEIVMHSATAATYVGRDGLRAAWLDWLAPWTTYRTEIEQVIDAGDRAVVFVRDFGRRLESSPEVSFTGAAVWTVRDGKIARIEFFAHRAEALEAAGLQTGDVG